ncbi:DHH family phosphoesterase [Clostridium sp. 19966]|uniref:DHH family phosphoesterase n=1 Tax=Clostridium sp. 19966 TaxID=2768166 RepID=UPI0028DDF641|nr:DHH family phosphoesterase [Clostridium sp. 19966]MDT8719301.1 DHH family phosphoesterase [Clostridium sp. 19966]
MDNKDYFSPSNKVYMVILAVLIILLFIHGHFIDGIVALIVYGILVVYYFVTLEVKKVEWKKFIENFSGQLDAATRNTLVNLPFPLIIIGGKGNIVWYNQNMSTVLKQEEILGKNVANVIKGLDAKTIKNSKENLFRYVKVKEKFYNVYTSVVHVSDIRNLKDEIILLYFYDMTEVKNIFDNKECVMLVEVDNLDDVVKTTEENQKPLLIAEIERTINNYAQSINAFVKKYGNNKYVLSVQDKYISEEIKKKFDILDTVREINMSNKLAVTLSVGIGRGGSTPIENESYANSAKELALGRGGDQVVIKNGDKLSFFGGKTKEVEKRTRVRARVIAHILKDLVSESSSVFIMGHRNPDADCFGAAVGLYGVLKTFKPECNIILDKPNHGIKVLLDEFNKDPDYNDVFITSEECKNLIDENSLIILVDVHNRGYVLNEELLKYTKRVVIIDHHRKSTDYIENTLFSYMETYASSTSELVTEIIQYMVEKPKIKQIEASALLAGICVDTKNFYFKTGVRTFEAASFLRRLGADTLDVRKLFSDDLNTYIKKYQIIESAKVEDGIAIAMCPGDITDTVIAAQAADELLNITGIQASFVLVKIEEDINISGRSLGDVNVQIIMEQLGGGGHMNIAGTKLSNMSMEDAVKLLKKTINENLKEGEK